MKTKFMFVLFIYAVSLMFGTSAFADFTQKNTDDDDPTTIVCGATDTQQISLSPSVNAGYTCADWRGSNDWYVIGTYHTGGTKAFATASSLTKIWKDTAGAGETAAENFANVPQTPETAASEYLWSEAGWDI